MLQLNYIRIFISCISLPNSIGRYHNVLIKNCPAVRTPVSTRLEEGPEASMTVGVVAVENNILRVLAILTNSTEASFHFFYLLHVQFTFHFQLSMM